MTGRFAPSPTGDLHLGNLRTAAIAWLAARGRGEPFVVRMEDLDLVQSNRECERSQLDDLASLGIDWDGDVVRQSERFDRYAAAIDQLAARGLVYECFCTRREIQDEIAASPRAPHGPPGSYPGTCRDLSADERTRRREQGRRPALRLRADGRVVSFHDVLAGEVTGVVDDVVLRRNDGVPAYNLAVVVDDAAQGVSEVVRGDDLLASTPRQIFLQELLDLDRPAYLHVPLVVDADGERLAKRRGVPLTLAQLALSGIAVATVIDWIATSLGMTSAGEHVSLEELIGRFDPLRISRQRCPLPPFVTGDHDQRG